MPVNSIIRYFSSENVVQLKHHTTTPPPPPPEQRLWCILEMISYFKQFNLLHQFTMHKQFDLTQNGKESKSKRKSRKLDYSFENARFMLQTCPTAVSAAAGWTSNSMLWCIIDNKRRTSIFLAQHRLQRFYAKLPRTYMCRSDHLFWLYIHVLIKLYDMY